MATLEEVFSPAQEIEEPERFAGREPQVRRAIRTLKAPGASFLIYGLRGVGKTSFAKQVRLIGMGNAELAHALNLSHELPSTGFQHPAIYFQCNDLVRDVTSLLRTICADADPVFGMGQFFDGTRLAERSSKSEGGVTAAAFGVSSTVKDESSEKLVPISDDALTTFRLLTLQIYEQRHAPLILVIDELDRLKDKTGLASLIKSQSHIKFVLVGIADDFAELVADHASVERQLGEGVIKIAPMNKAELVGIIRKGEAALEGLIKYESAACDLIADRSGGYPYFAHLLAKEAGYQAMDHGQPIVTRDHVGKAIRDVVQTQKAPTYEKTYHAAVKASPQCEIVLKAFADDKNDQVYTRDVYPLCNDLGVSNASQYVGTLVQRQILQNCDDAQYYKFADPLFRVYVQLRNFKFGG